VKKNILSDWYSDQRNFTATKAVKTHHVREFIAHHRYSGWLKCSEFKLFFSL